MSPDDEEDDAVADAGRDVEEQSRDDHGGGRDPLGPAEVVAASAALAKKDERLGEKASKQMRNKELN